MSTGLFWGGVVCQGDGAVAAWRDAGTKKKAPNISSRTSARIRRSCTNNKTQSPHSTDRASGRKILRDKENLHQSSSWASGVPTGKRTVSSSSILRSGMQESGSDVARPDRKQFRDGFALRQGKPSTVIFTMPDAQSFKQEGVGLVLGGVGPSYRKKRRANQSLWVNLRAFVPRFTN